MRRRFPFAPAPVAASILLAGLVVLFFWKILLTNLILVGVDTFLYFYPYRAYASEALRQGRLPLWNPHLFMGVPFLANSQAGVLYPLNWLFLWLSPPRQVAASMALHTWLAAVGMLAYARRSLRLGWPGALLAAMLFALGGFLGAQVDHPNQLQVSAWLPWLFLLYDEAVAGRRRWTAVLLLAALIALTLLAGHSQAVFISLVGVGLYGVLRLQVTGFKFQVPGFRRRVSVSNFRWAGKRLISNLQSLISTLQVLAVAAGLALLLAAAQLLPTLELARQSIRRSGLSYNEATSFSLRPWTAHFTFLPPFGLDLSVVFGEAFSEWVAYAGLAGLGLAALGLLTLAWRREAAVFALLGLAGAVLALGRATGPLYLVLYKFVPGFNLFRAPARWLLLYAFAVAVLAGLGLDALASRPIEVRAAAGRLVAWIGQRRWAQATLLIAAVALAVVLFLILEPVPALPGLVWLAGAGWVAALIVLGLRRPARAPQVAIVLLVLSGLELFWAAQSLRYNRPTAPEAYSSLRPAVTQLLTAQDAGHHRFLSLSGIRYDPGDLRELEGIYGDQLPPEAVYQLVVAAKEKEVLFFNLPLLYRLYSVDGYDGGLLPLAQFVELQKLFLDEDRLAVDGRLRENLRDVPPGRLLSLLGVRHIVTDKVYDVWIDDIFYDLQFSARLGGTGPHAIRTEIVPDFPATAVGLVSYLEGGASLPDGAPVAEVIVTTGEGRQHRFVLRAGIDTAEGKYPPNAAHARARAGHTWRDDPAGFDYITVLEWEEMARPAALEVVTLAEGGRFTFVLRGLSLINQPTTTGRSLLLSTEGDYRRIHDGDVKVYENLGVLPRAFIVHEMETVPGEAEAIAALRDPEFDPSQRALRVGGTPGLVRRGAASPADSVILRRYEPERVEIEVNLDQPGWLILTDTYYPGWEARVDGRPVPIEAVDVLFRSVAVPAGRHQVVFEFRPRSFRWGAWISGVTLGLWLALLGWSFKRGQVG
ncbi:MAG: YfhO family protein [Anaerolineae bacterium]